jgi:hypothetical protein
VKTSYRIPLDSQVQGDEVNDYSLEEEKTPKSLIVFIIWIMII